jgi:hypothetical protein
MSNWVDWELGSTRGFWLNCEEEREEGPAWVLNAILGAEIMEIIPQHF